MITNPPVVVEVLPATTEAWERGWKFAQYRRGASGQEYVLVSTEPVCLEWFPRDVDGTWLLRVAEGLQGYCGWNGWGLCWMWMLGKYARDREEEDRKTTESEGVRVWNPIQQTGGEILRPVRSGNCVFVAIALAKQND